jgi:hypothetical protein
LAKYRFCQIDVQRIGFLPNLQSTFVYVSPKAFLKLVMDHLFRLEHPGDIAQLLPWYYTNLLATRHLPPRILSQLEDCRLQICTHYQLWFKEKRGSSLRLLFYLSFRGLLHRAVAQPAAIKSPNIEESSLSHAWKTEAAGNADRSIPDGRASPAGGDHTGSSFSARRVMNSYQLAIGSSADVVSSSKTLWQSLRNAG